MAIDFVCRLCRLQHLAIHNHGHCKRTFAKDSHTLELRWTINGRQTKQQPNWWANRVKQTNSMLTGSYSHFCNIWCAFLGVRSFLKTKKKQSVNRLPSADWLNESKNSDYRWITALKPTVITLKCAEQLKMWYGRVVRQKQYKNETRQIISHCHSMWQQQLDSCIVCQWNERKPIKMRRWARRSTQKINTESENIYRTRWRRMMKKKKADGLSGQNKLLLNASVARTKQQMCILIRQCNTNINLTHTNFSRAYEHCQCHHHHHALHLKKSNKTSRIFSVIFLFCLLLI